MDGDDELIQPGHDPGWGSSEDEMLMEAKSAETLDFDKIADMIDERDLLIRRLRQGQELSSELFEQE